MSLDFKIRIATMLLIRYPAIQYYQGTSNETLEIFAAQGDVKLTKFIVKGSRKKLAYVMDTSHFML